MSENPEWGANNPNYSEETPVFGDDRGLGDLFQRAARGALPLLAYGAIGTLAMSAMAYQDYQIPLSGGFTMVTPWSSKPNYYDAGEVGQSQDFQYHEFLAGQPVLGPFRTHTTGIIDYGVRHSWPFAAEAEDLVHPGRKELLSRERQIVQVADGTFPASVVALGVADGDIAASTPSTLGDRGVVPVSSSATLLTRRRRRSSCETDHDCSGDFDYGSY
jgi:hypothetical protein